MLTVKQYYRRLILEKIKGYIKLALFGLFVACSLRIIQITITGINTPDKLNKCLKTHDLEYCNNNIK